MGFLFNPEISEALTVAPDVVYSPIPLPLTTKMNPLAESSVRRSSGSVTQLTAWRTACFPKDIARLRRSLRPNMDIYSLFKRDPRADDRAVSR
jgi:hypothetical protein